MSKPQPDQFTSLQDDKKYRLLFESAPLAIFILDGYEFIECNEKAADLFGYPKEEIIGNSPAQFSTDIQPNGQDAGSYARDLIKKAQAGEIQHFEWNVLWPDNSVRLISVALTPIYIEGEITTLTHAIARDITELRAREEEEERQKQLLQQISQSTSEYIFIKDLEGRYQYLNRAAADFLGMSAEEVIGKDDFEVFGGDMATTLQNNDRHVIESGKLVTYEEIVGTGGDERIFETTKGPFHAVDGSIAGVFGISRDVTELREANEQTEQLARELHERVKELTCINRVTDILEKRGVPIDELLQEIVGQIPPAMQHPDIAVARIDIGTREFVSEGFSEQPDSLFEEIRSKSEIVGHIEVHYSEVRSQPVFLQEEHDLLKLIANKIGGVLEREQDDENIRRLAFYDSLTNLPNRQLLIDRMQQAVHACHRNHTNSALLYLDLDNFKNLNDSHGHDAGDLFLRQVADRLSNAVRETDTVARFGGDEFVMILEGLSPDNTLAVSEASNVAEKILQSFSQPFKLDDYLHYATASMGVTLFGSSHVEPEELLKQADISMYQAKSSGRNTYRFFDPNMQALLNVRVQMDNDMRHGLQNDEFELYYQPQVASNNQVVGCEALLRWQHPEQGMVMPAIFIPIAEDTGLIIQLGRWVLESACKQLVEWADDPVLGNMLIAVNVSANQFRHPDFVSDVLEVLQQTGARPDRLKLELTEGFIIADIEDAIAKMTALKKQGIALSLDDFGTGYSSLSYLKRLPIDELKIDRAFINNILTNDNDAAIARTIIALGKTLGLSVVAEGVETEAQLQFLFAEGCDLYQGYVFSKPVPGSDFATLLEKCG